MLKMDKSIRYIQVNVLVQQTSLLSVLLRISCLLLRVVLFDYSTSIWMISSSQFLCCNIHRPGTYFHLQNETVPLRSAIEMSLFYFIQYNSGDLCLSVWSRKVLVVILPVVYLDNTNVHKLNPSYVALFYIYNTCIHAKV